MPRKKSIAVLALILAAAPGLSAYGSTAQAKTKAIRPKSAEVSAGKGLFEMECAACHGVRGEGTAIGPGFRMFKRAQSIKGVIEQLTKPLEPVTGTKMPTFSKLTAAQKEELGAYVTVELTRTVKIAK